MGEEAQAPVRSGGNGPPRRGGGRRVIWLVVVLVSVLAGIQATSGERLSPEVTQQRECRTCHHGPYRLDVDDTKDPWCSNCHALHGVGETLGLSRARRVAEKKGGGPIVEQAMVTVPGGPFPMGDDHFKASAGPRHTVNLPAYQIDQFDVTNALYQKFVEATDRPPPPYWNGRAFPLGKENHPVVLVSWFDADAYCRWAGKRLPSEAEWEKAARGTTGRVYPWGDKLEVNRANIPNLAIGDTTPVNAFPEGRSPYGLYDMSGNVFQWTSDWFLPYPGNTTPHPNYGENDKVLRGGSFFDCSNYRCGISFQTFNRISLTPRTRSISAGFRCARSVE